MKIAIIVPVYNVDKYLIHCIKSLINQTRKNYNIYLIDDGSTDESGKICDKYANKYKNIYVFHKKNGGLSDARNYGVKHTKEPLITFVDSDDTIREDYIEKLYTAMIETKVDIAVANYIPVKKQVLNEKGNIDNNYSIEESKRFLKSALIGKKGSLSACCKIFKRDLLEKNPFPKGKLYEDMEIIYKIISSVQNVCYIDENLYFYLTRENSIVQSRVTERHKYGILSCIHILNMEKKNSKLRKYIKCRIVKQACGHLPNLIKYDDYNMFYDISKITRRYIASTIFCNVAPLKLKITSLAYYLPPKLGIKYAKFLFDTKKRIINR